MAPEHDARPELAGQGQVLLAEDLLHQGLLVVGVVDDEAAADADGLAIPPQHPGAQGVERAGLDVAAALTDEADDPLAELAGGLVGERHGEDAARRDALDADQIGDAVGEHAGLARAGAREDQQRPLRRGDGTGLLGVERLEDLRFAVRPTLGQDLGVEWRRRRCSGVALGCLGRRIAQPLGFVGNGLRDVGGDGARSRLGVVEDGIAGAATAPWAHPGILGRGARRGLIRPLPPCRGSVPGSGTTRSSG